LAVNNEVDSIMDVTLGAFEAMQAQNPNIIAWKDGMPFVWLDPCARQISIETGPQNAPWDDPEMRWVLNNATDRQEIVDIAYEGVTIPSRTIYVEYGGLFPTIDAIEEAGMAMSPNADLDAAEATLLAKGYERGPDGLWQKDGHVLSIRIQVNEGFIEKRRIAADVVEQWQKFGINASSDIVAGATWESNKNAGLYEATGDWDSCGSINEPWATLNRYTSDKLRPIGENSAGDNHQRWQGPDNDAYTEIVNEIGTLPLGDPQIIPMVVEAYRYFYDALPTIPVTQATKLVPFNTTYWTGWPTAENNYNHPATWWQSVHQIFQHLTKASM
jgi:peptide/nickel transport system substrate-binding protein